MIKSFAMGVVVLGLVGCAMEPVTNPTAPGLRSSDDSTYRKEVYTGSRIPVKDAQRPVSEIDGKTFEEFRQNQRAAGSPGG